MFWGVPYYDNNIIYPPNPILTAKAPIVFYLLGSHFKVPPNYYATLLKKGPKKENCCRADVIANTKPQTATCRASGSEQSTGPLGPVCLARAPGVGTLILRVLEL